MTLLLAYLKSYQHMGTATVACVAGCSCKTVSIDGHNRIRESTTHLLPFEVGHLGWLQRPAWCLSVSVSVS